VCNFLTGKMRVSCRTIALPQPVQSVYRGLVLHDGYLLTQLLFFSFYSFTRYPLYLLFHSHPCSQRYPHDTSYASPSMVCTNFSRRTRDLTQTQRISRLLWQRLFPKCFLLVTTRVSIMMPCLLTIWFKKQTGRAQNSMDLPRRHQRDPYAPVDLDNAVADVFNAPLGSFTEDSPPRGGCSSSDDERMKRHAQRSPRNSPQGSPLGGRHTMPPQQSYPPPYDRGGYHSYQRKPPYPGAPPAGAPSSHRGVPPPPPYHASGRDSYPPQPPPGYPPQQAYYGYPPQQQHQQPEHNWNSPPALDDSFPPHPVTDSNNKLMMRGSPLRGSPLRGPPMRSSPLRASPAREPRGFSSISTPDKRPGKIFRSPPSTRASPPSNRKSPMFHASPSIGGYGSFGMIDTPGGTLAADFSPMGPSFAGLGDETPAPPSNDAFGGRQLNLSRSTSSGEFGAPMIQQRPTKADQSPFGAFINDFSPAFASNNSLPNVPRSPVRSASQARRAQGGPPHFSHSQEHPPSAILEEVRSIAPVAAPAASEAKPRQLWQESGAGAGAMRLELGTRTHSTQRHLEGINSMMRAQQQQGGIPQHYSTPSSHHAYGGLQHPGAPRGPPISHHVQSSFPHPMNTPMKGPPRQQQMRMAQPPAHYAPSASMTKQAPPPSQHQSQQQQHQAQQQHQRNFAPVAITAPQVKQGSSGGKENTAGAKGRRGPCNCKKSKCLKLYCECFSQERFCDGCNCVECNNIPSFANVRDKAIKETRAKNAEAFKPRITGGHNMGCKCKKSECLKKYCEVSVETICVVVLCLHCFFIQPLTFLFFISVSKRDSCAVPSASAVAA